ncbi:MAG: putative DNA binding domain-containing protein [Deltaproteobacteria bacterium]|nr:putative DNA binding domain-containing protein [Deltaproteobacteria bacterium]
MTDAELLQLFRTRESDRVERKESLSDGVRVCQAICALANDLPAYKATGVVFIGQRDDLSCAGLQVDDALLRTLGGYRQDGRLMPFPTMYVRKVTLDGCEVAAVEVEPSDNPPVRFEGRTWIRVGPRRAIATAEEERRLVEKRRYGNLPFDAQGVAGASLGDVDLRRFELEYLPAAISPEALAQNQRTRDQQLRALRLTQPGDIPTATAILMLGTDPRRWFPGAYIQYLRVAGTALTDQLLDQREIAGPLPDQLRHVDDVIRLNVQRRTTVGGQTRVDVVDYPEEALRQLVRNAVLHRSYEGTNAPVRLTWFDDRVEIQSPGGPFGQVTVEHFGEPGVTDYRNPTLAEALKAMGYVERFGVGIPIARERLAANGNPPVRFTVEAAHILATVFRRP